MSAHAGAVPVQTAIDRIGFGRFQKRLLGVCGVTWAADAAEIFLIAFALPKITEDFGVPVPRLRRLRPRRRGPARLSLFAEYLPTRNRGRWLVILESFWGVGTVAAAALAWLLVPTLGWRYLLATSAIAVALIFWVRLRVPESPRFLAATGRVDEAEAVLAQVARENHVPERDVPHIVPPADASASRGVMEPSVSTSRISLSRSVICSTRVFSTV